MRVGYILLFLWQVSCQNLTLRGCVCKDQWILVSVEYVRCQNPDNDPNGLWCFVENQNCTNGQAGEVLAQGSGIGEFYDYCIEEQLQGEDDPHQIQPTEFSPQPQPQLQPQPDSPTQNNIHQQTTQCNIATIGGCECSQEWEFRGALVYGCTNLDNDPRGSWCMIKSASDCSGVGPIKSVEGEISGIFDYCESDCETEDEAATISTDADVQEFIWEGPCQSSRSGCECVPEWTYDGDLDTIPVAYYGCARTIDDSTAPWCPIVSTASCTSPPHSTDLGGIYSNWDYCDTRCTPPTKGACSITERGCDCMQFWRYDGKLQQGCTRPDLDIGKSWCVVDPESCTSAEGPLGQLPEIGDFWDYCNSSCL